MNTKKIALALVAGTALLAAAPAFADGWRGHLYHPHHTYRAPVYVYYPVRPVFVAPPPYYYAPPAPRVVYPAPVVYGSIPVGPGVQIGFRARL